MYRALLVLAALVLVALLCAPRAWGQASPPAYRGVAVEVEVATPDGGLIVRIPETVLVDGRLNSVGYIGYVEAPIALTAQSFQPLVAPTCVASRGHYLTVTTTAVQVSPWDGGIERPSTALVTNRANVEACCDQLAEDGGVPDCTTYGTPIPPNYGSVLFEGLEGHPLYCRSKVGNAALNVKESACAPTLLGP
jgi:hypothetical protein